MTGAGRRRRALRVALALTVGSGLVACGIGDGEPKKATGVHVVQHAMGKTEIPDEPLRVVTLDDTFTSAALALNAEVVGYTTAQASDPELPGYLGADAKTHASKARWVGTLSDPNVERIVELRPDLILSAKVRHEQLYEQLSSIAPTVFSETTGATWKENLRLTGRALGKEQLAERELAEYERRAKTVGDNIRAAVGHNPTISIVRFAGEPTARLYTRTSFPGIVRADAGLAEPEGRPEGEGIATNLSQERIGDLDAEHIFISVYPDTAGDAAHARSDFQANPLWRQLRGEQHEVDDITWMTAVGPHGAHAILDDLARTFGVDSAR